MGIAERTLRFFTFRRAGEALANVNGADSAKAPLYPFDATVEKAGENGSVLAEGLAVVSVFEVVDALFVLVAGFELEDDAEQLDTTMVDVFANV